MKQFLYAVVFFESAFFGPVLVVHGGWSIWRAARWALRLFRPPFSRPSQYDYPLGFKR